MQSQYWRTYREKIVLEITTSRWRHFFASNKGDANGDGEEKSQHFSDFLRRDCPTTTTTMLLMLEWMPSSFSLPPFIPFRPHVLFRKKWHRQTDEKISLSYSFNSTHTHTPTHPHTHSRPITHNRTLECNLQTLSLSPTQTHWCVIITSTKASLSHALVHIRPIKTLLHWKHFHKATIKWFETDFTWI